MGLKLRLNLFSGTDAQAVYVALESFWTAQGYRLEAGPGGYVLHETRDGWTQLDWDAGWEWDLRRKAQLHVSRVLDRPGLLVFVYDGDYWGYELFARGEEVDHFVQDPERTGWFPDRDCTGRPELVAAQFPAHGLRPSDVAPYLVPRPDDWWPDDGIWDAPARPGDEYGRGAECAVLDFLRLLGVRIGLRERYVTPAAPAWKAFRVVG